MTTKQITVCIWLRYIPSKSSLTKNFNTYNKNNELISVDEGYIALFLEPGEEAGFEVEAYCDVEQYDHYTYNIKWSEAD